MTLAAEPRRAGREERILRGTPLAPGIAIGTVHLHDAGLPPIPRYPLLSGQVVLERARLAEAVARADRQLTKLKTRSVALPEAIAGDVADLFDAHLAMLSGSRLVRGADQRIEAQKINAEQALVMELDALSAQFGALDDPYIAARVQDVRAVTNRVIRNLLDRKHKAFAALPEGAIIAAEEISAADVAVMDPRRVGGYVTCLGAHEGHAAIMARALGLPAVGGVRSLRRLIGQGGEIIIDGGAGLVILNPGAARRVEFEARREALRAERNRLKEMRELPAQTKDGTEIRLMANLELAQDRRRALKEGAEGAGLVRTEFLFMNRADLPTTEEQYEALADLVASLEGKPATIRTLDLGGDKLAAALRDRLTPTDNPALGLRGIRLSLRFPDLLEGQFAAILRAGALGPVRIMLPMVNGPEEVAAAREILDRARASLDRSGQPHAADVPLGVMIETPAAALCAPALARVADFFSIGSNDLTQYALAVDRGDEQVAPLYDMAHPAVLRLMGLAIKAAAEAGIPIALCGEIAGEPRFTPLLLGLGLRELSMSPNFISAVKERIRQLDITEAEDEAAAALAGG